MSIGKLKILMKAFIPSQFGYCPVIWMFHNRKLNAKINRLHERALKIVYKDHSSGRLRQPTIFYGNFLSLFDYLRITQSKSRIRSVVNVQYNIFHGARS